MNLADRLVRLTELGYLDATGRIIWAAPDPTDTWPPATPAPCFVDRGCDALSTAVAAITQINDPTQIVLPEEYSL